MKELSEVLQDWEAVIGLEIHTELTALDTKMFCNCKLSHDDEPNANVCPVCLGLPGALPVPNKKAIESIVKAGLATNCEIQKHSMFYRKHYFYPDMAKNFQTTQGPVAFAMYGHLDLDVTGQGAAERPDCAFGAAEAESLASASANAEGLSTSMTSQMREGNQRAGHLASYDASNMQMPERRADGSYTVPIRILRIHMEEDAAKMVHVGGAEGRITAAAESLVDYNRCGTPLIELVTEPDLRTPEEARLFMEKLRRIFVTLGISDCSMEKGSMRCDGNVSLRRRGETKLGTKTELKNLNSFKSLHDGLAYEICRQAEVLEEGGIIYQETRHWEPSRKRTVVMRVRRPTIIVCSPTPTWLRLIWTTPSSRTAASRSPSCPTPSVLVLRPILASRQPMPSRSQAILPMPISLRRRLRARLVKKPKRLRTCWSTSLLAILRARVPLSMRAVLRPLRLPLWQSCWQVTPSRAIRRTRSLS